MGIKQLELQFSDYFDSSMMNKWMENENRVMKPVSGNQNLKPGTSVLEAITENQCFEINFHIGLQCAISFASSASVMRCFFLLSSYSLCMPAFYPSNSYELV